jgi:hypothetical protein
MWAALPCSVPFSPSKRAPMDSITHTSAPWDHRAKLARTPCSPMIQRSRLIEGRPVASV